MKKHTVYCLSMDGQTAIHMDINGVCDAIKMEFEDQDYDSMKNCTYEVSVKQMTDKEINELPEFDGF